MQVFNFARASSKNGYRWQWWGRKAPVQYPTANLIGTMEKGGETPPSCQIGFAVGAKRFYIQDGECPDPEARSVRTCKQTHIELLAHSRLLAPSRLLDQSRPCNTSSKHTFTHRPPSQVDTFPPPISRPCNTSSKPLRGATWKVFPATWEHHVRAGCTARRPRLQSHKRHQGGPTTMAKGLA